MRRKFSRAMSPISAADFSPPKHIVKFRTDHAPVPRVEMKRQPAADPAHPGDKWQRQQLDEGDERAAKPIYEKVHPWFHRKQILRTQS